MTYPIHGPFIDTDKNVSDNSCVLLPKRQQLALSRGLRDKIIGCLSTRYTATPAAIRAALPVEVQEWAKVRILNDGDTIRASSLDTGATSEDGRNASYVRVSTLASYIFREELTYLYDLLNAFSTSYLSTRTHAIVGAR